MPSYRLSAPSLLSLVLGAFCVNACGGSSASLAPGSDASVDADLDAVVSPGHESGPDAQDEAAADASVDRSEPDASPAVDAEAGAPSPDAAADAGADAQSDTGAPEAAPPVEAGRDAEAEAGPCIPDCTGAVCGGSDGCGGTCQSGSCATGLHCVSGACTCDAQSCPTGCCDGNGCETVENAGACGTGGVTCAVCSGTTPSCLTGACCVATTALATSSWTLSPNLVINIATTTHYQCVWLVDSHTYDYTTCDGWISDVFIASDGSSAVVGWNLVTNAMYTKQWNSNPYSPTIAQQAAQWAVQTTFPGGNLSDLTVE